MKYKNISKTEIKKYIKALEVKLKKLQEQIKEANKENENSNIQLYDLTDMYITEAKVEGQLMAANYILKNCYKVERRTKWKVL